MSDVIGRGVIEVDIDGSGIKAGVAESKRSLADLAKIAEQSGERAAKSVESIAAGGDKSARKLEQSTRSMISSIQRQIAVMEAGSKGSAKYYEAIARQRGISTDALKPYLDQLDAAKNAQQAVGVSAGQTANALRMLPAQFSDIATSLASGQSPFMVMVQQGGQLKDSFGGIGPATKALGGYVAGLLGPFTIATAAVGALALAYKQGSDEQTAFTQSLVTTGNIAGVTTMQLAVMAAEIDEQVGTTHQAAAALNQLVATGRIYGGQLKELAQAAVAWERATGVAVEDTVKQFAELAKDPVEASRKLNDTYHYLTLATYEQIKALQDQGREQEAAALAEKTYATELEKRSKEIEKSLGVIESAWKSVKGGAAEAWDAILGIGREATLDERIKKLNMLRGFASPQRGREIDAEIDQLSTQKLAQEANERMWAEERRVQQEGISAEALIAKLREDSLSNAEKREKARAEYRRNIEKIRVANPDSPLLDPAKQSRDIANINEKFKDKPGKDLFAEMRVDMDNMARKAMEAGDVMQQVAKNNEAYITGLEKNVEDARKAVDDTSSFLLTDEQRLAESYERRQAMLDSAHEYGLISEEKFQQLKIGLEEKYAQDSRAVSDDYWERYLAAAEENLLSFDELAGSTIETFSRGFGDAFEDVIFEAESVGDAFDGMMQGMARAVVSALGQMAAQWLAYKVVQLATGKATQSVAATSMIANAQAMSLQAQINAFASMAAIPVYGWAAAPGAAATAAAITEPLVAAVSAAALAGIAHDGMSTIPREGTWLLDGGERVVAPQQNRDLTQFLQSQQNQRPRSGGDFIFAPTVQAADSRDAQRLLQRGGALEKEMRRMHRNYVLSRD